MKLRKILPIILSLVMVFSALPIRVLAEEEVSTWADLQAALAAGGTVNLTSDVTAGEGDIALSIPSGVTAELNLNNCTINRNLTARTENGNVITNKGTLTINGPGTITGGYNNKRGGGIDTNGGTLTINEGVAIKGNHTDNSGNGQGGGVYIGSGSFTMNNSSVCDNTSTGEGGGVYVLLNSHFYISGNSRITDNKKGNADNNLYIAGQAKAHVNYLGPDARIGVSTKKKNGDILSFEANNVDNIEYFVSDKPEYRFELDEDFSSAGLVSNYYAITIEEADNGVIQSNMPSAFPGERVTLTVEPEEDYVLKNLTVRNLDANENVVLDGYSFIMPAGEVEVTAKFDMPDM